MKNTLTLASACAAALSLAIPCAAWADASSGAASSDDAAKGYIQAFYAAQGNEILSKYDLVIPKDMKYHQELDLKDKIVKAAQDATAAAGGTKIKEVRLGAPKIFDDGKRANYTYEVAFENGKAVKGRVQAEQLQDGKWKIPLEEKQLPPEAKDCLAVFAKNRGRGFISASQMLGGGGDDEDPSVVKITVPGFFAYASDTDYSYLMAFPTSDSRVPAEDRKYWNFYSSESTKFKSEDYKEEYQKSYALLKAYETAGYLKLEEGMVDFDYYDAFSNPKIQKATLAGVKINFTDKGKKEILSGDKSRYHGLPTLMLMGKTAPEVKGDITMQKGTKGLMSWPDTFTCPISFGLKAPDGVDSKIVAAYLKACAPFTIPRDTEIRLVWNEKENAFEKGY